MDPGVITSPGHEVNLMNELEKQLLREAAGGTEPRLSLRTLARVDAGQWGRRAPLWLCVMEKELVLLAVARRRYLERVPLSACSGSFYCHAAGELVVAPAEGLAFNRIALSAADGLNVLQCLNPKICPQQPENQHA